MCLLHTVSAAPLSLLLFFTDGADIMDRNGQKIGTLFGSHYVVAREEMLSVDIHREIVVWKYCVCVRACVRVCMGILVFIHACEVCGVVCVHSNEDRCFAL